jgi:hypothetical protein
VKRPARALDAPKRRGRPAEALTRVARATGLVASAALALSIVLLPWYALDDYVPNGWDATFWARAALVLAVANLVLLRLRPGSAGSVALTAAALALVAARVALPPDFGFDFDGLDVPVERRIGAWTGLLAAAAALAAALAPTVLRSARPGASPAARAAPPRSPVAGE